MKKNKMMRTASGLLVAVLLTTCIISGTFAKYVTGGSASDTARVAKWGIAITAEGSLFSDAYIAKGTNGDVPLTTAHETTTDPTEVTVAIKTHTITDNIVAPGTKNAGTGLTYTLTGTPEVAFKLTTETDSSDIYLKSGTYGYMAKVTKIDEHNFGALKADLYVAGETDDTYTKVDDDADFDDETEYFEFVTIASSTDFSDTYYPVTYEMTGATPGGTKASDIANALKTAFDGSDGGVYSANTSLANVGTNAGKVNVSWAWAFEGTGDETAKAKVDAKDTVLGDLIAKANSDTTAVEIYSLTGDTATQVEFETVTPENAKFARINAKVGDTTVACLTTGVYYSITATQVD